MKYTIVLDAGHGGKDSGAVGNGLREKDLTLSMALKVEKELKRMYGDQVNVIQTRRTDTFYSLTHRKNIGNQIPYSNGKYQGVFVSFHINSADNPTAIGWEVFSANKNSKGTALAKNIEQETIPYINRNRGVKHSPFTVITCNPPSALIESAFISNSADIGSYLQLENTLATAYAIGIGNYLKLSKEAPVHWAEQYYNKLTKRGITIDEKRYDDNITRGEVFALIEKVLYATQK